MSEHERDDRAFNEAWQRGHGRHKSGIERPTPAFTYNYQLRQHLRQLSAPEVLTSSELEKSELQNSSGHKRKLSEIYRLFPEVPTVRKGREASLRSLAGSLANLESQREEAQDTTRWTLLDLKTDTGVLLDTAARVFKQVRPVILLKLEWFDFGELADAFERLIETHDKIYPLEVQKKLDKNNELHEQEFRGDLLEIHERLPPCKVPRRRHYERGVTDGD